MNEATLDKLSATEANSGSLQLFRDERALWPKAKPLPRFWWRDDDLTKSHPMLDRMLQIADRRGIPIAFAAIPSGLTVAATDRVRASNIGRIAVHGYAHVNHAPDGSPRSEYPQERRPGDVLRELLAGRCQVRDLAGDRFLNMFVPPWGRFDSCFDPLLREAGFVSLSGAKASVHYDIPIQQDCQVATEHHRVPIHIDRVLGRVTRELKWRRMDAVARSKPIGLMTHHNVLNDELLVHLELVLDVLQTCGFEFADFQEIDRAPTTKRASSSAPRCSHVQIEPSIQTPMPTIKGFDLELAEMLLKETTPRVADTPVASALGRALGELGKTSAISLLRYIHMEHEVAALPAGARVLSAGCGKALAEVALAMSHPLIDWLGLDIESVRYERSQRAARAAGATNIQFAQADLEKLDRAGFGEFDLIVLSEVAVYLEDPGRVIRALRSHLKPGGTLAWVEPFLPGADVAQKQKLRDHTRSIHGGFNHDQMRAFVGGMDVQLQTSCYWRAPTRLVRMVWDHMSAAAQWGLLDLSFALARTDLATGIADKRAEATAVKILARQPR